MEDNLHHVSKFPSTEPAASPEKTADEHAGLYMEVWEFWKRYQRSLLWVCGGVLALLVAYHAVQIYRSWSLRHMQEAFWVAETHDQKVGFAKRYDSEPLGGVMLLSLGQEALKKSNFTEAAQFYKKAIPALSKNALVSRARIGYAIAESQSGSAEGKKEACRVLQEVAALTNIPEVFRAEALYTMAVINFDSKDYVASKANIEELGKMGESAVFFQQKASFLKKHIPAR